jgi:sigma-B regulation protein RsbU (phosphoserine phosphatase)
MVTAKDQSENVVEALELGANDYVTKPLDFPVVLARIRTQLALRQSVARVTELEQKLTGRNQELEGASRALTTANGRMKRDLEAAARVQRAFLPTAPPEACGARFAWAFRPCAELAGDFLNVFRLDDQRLGLCVLDVKGHGPAAALLSVAVSQFLARVSALPSSVPGLAPPPAEVAAHMSRQFSADPATGQLLTFLYGILDLDECAFRFAAAGHPGPVHLPRQGEGKVVEAPGLPVGLGEAAYREHTVQLGPGDRLYLYCEGLTEARNPDGEHFGGRRLVDALQRGRVLSLAEGLSALVEEVEQWCAAPLQDDVAILAVEVTGPADRGE